MRLWAWFNTESSLSRHRNDKSSSEASFGIRTVTLANTRLRVLSTTSAIEILRQADRRTIVEVLFA